ncbi:hypothetical protein Taro_005281, partial [Colocasia esculenta]|nr:hypothetical protein [Colocasia esculenta]
ELELRSLASTSIDARFFSWELDGQIPCRLYSINGSRCCRQHKFEMADRRDWGGGGDDPEESTQHMIERI